MCVQCVSNTSRCNCPEKYAHVACLINRKLLRLAVTILAVTLFFNRITSKFYYVSFYLSILSQLLDYIYTERCDRVDLSSSEQKKVDLYLEKSSIFYKRYILVIHLLPSRQTISCKHCVYFRICLFTFKLSSFLFLSRYIYVGPYVRCTNTITISSSAK